jgi:hypothetical protein
VSGEIRRASERSGGHVGHGTNAGSTELRGGAGVFEGDGGG